MSARRVDAEARISLVAGTVAARILQPEQSESCLWGQVVADRCKLSVPCDRLDDDGFLVFAEETAQGVGDFADRGVGFDRSENCWQKVLAGGGTAGEFR